jgi:hypothetical protein
VKYQLVDHIYVRRPVGDDVWTLTFRRIPEAHPIHSHQRLKVVTVNQTIFEGLDHARVYTDGG